MYLFNASPTRSLYVVATIFLEPHALIYIFASGLNCCAFWLFFWMISIIVLNWLMNRLPLLVRPRGLLDKQCMGLASLGSNRFITYRFSLMASLLLLAQSDHFIVQQNVVAESDAFMVKVTGFQFIISSGCFSMTPAKVVFLLPCGHLSFTVWWGNNIPVIFSNRFNLFALKCTMIASIFSRLFLMLSDSSVSETPVLHSVLL